MNDILKDVSMAHRIVVKVGTSTLTYEHGTMNLKLIDRLSMVLSDLRNQGKEIILVSSGAQGIALDKDSDLALVKVGRLGLKPISFAQSDSIFAGQSVVAIGTPLSLSMRNSASKGIVSGLNVSTPSAYYPSIPTPAYFEELIPIS